MSTPAPQPSIGRTVHVVSPSPGYRDNRTIVLPGTIFEVLDDQGISVGVGVISRRGVHSQNCRYEAEGVTVGTWHWPPRVDGPGVPVLD